MGDPIKKLQAYKNQRHFNCINYQKSLFNAQINYSKHLFCTFVTSPTKIIARKSQTSYYHHLKPILKTNIISEASGGSTKNPFQKKTGNKRIAKNLACCKKGHAKKLSLISGTSSSHRGVVVEIRKQLQSKSAGK